MTGFWVKVGEGYKGPFERLNEARDEARKIGPDLEIYHGYLDWTSEGKIDTSQISLIPKYRKE